MEGHEQRPDPGVEGERMAYAADRVGVPAEAEQPGAVGDLGEVGGVAVDLEEAHRSLVGRIDPQ